MGRYKQSTQHEDHSGCIWGLISTFHFRQGRFAQRLISDRWRHGSSRHAAGAGFSKGCDSLLTIGGSKSKDLNSGATDLADGDELPTGRVESMTRIKEFINTEISNMPHSKKESPIDSGEHLDRIQQQINKTHPGANDQQLADLEASKVLQPHSSVERFPVMEEFCWQNHEQTNGNDSFDAAHERPSCIICNEPNKPQMQLVMNQTILEEKEGQAFEAFLIKKLIDAIQLFRDEPLNQSKEFMEVLEILNSNKELFVKLLQDPNSLLVKYIKELQNACEGVEAIEEEKLDLTQCEEIINHKQSQRQNIRSFFRRKEKGKGKKETDGSQALSKIVVLKPTDHTTSIQISTDDTIPSTSAQSHFSLRDIRKKWKGTTRKNKKERRWVSEDGILHNIPYGNQEAGDANKELDSKKRTSKPSTSTKKKDKRGKQKECKLSTKHEVVLPSLDLDGQLNTTIIVPSHQREAIIYEEAKKHLAEMLNMGGADGEYLPKQVPKSLGRILSLAEYMSPITSPRKAEEHSSLPEQTESENFQHDSENEEFIEEAANADNSSPSMMNVQSSTLCNHKNEVAEVNLHIKSLVLSEGPLSDTNIQESICIEGDTSQKGGVHMEESSVCMEGNDFMDIPIEPDSDRLIADRNESTDVSENCGGEERSECLGLEPYEESQQQESLSASPSGSPLHICKIEDPDSMGEKLERPSPVSVLDPFYEEDIIRHRSVASSLDDLPMQLRQLQFEEQANSILTSTSDPEIYPRICMRDQESEFEYVKAVLEASALSCEDFIGICHSSDQLLHPSLFEELEVSFTQSSSDRKLLFDCTNEVLMEVYERFFGSSPLLSLVKPNIWPTPTAKHVVREVWKGIDRNLVQEFPFTLDQLIGKDMAKAGTWVDLQFDAECIGVEIEDAILEELLEETIQELLH